jgi:hypothetical protein
LQGAWLLSGAAHAACPASVATPVGAATGRIEITLLPGNTATVGGSGNPVYDGIEDTLINVTNLSGGIVNSIHLTANTDIFGLDGDGISLYFGPIAGPAGYEGPGTSFTNYSSPFFNSGDVLFPGGLATSRRPTSPWRKPSLRQLHPTHYREPRSGPAGWGGISWGFDGPRWSSGVAPPAP